MSIPKKEKFVLNDTLTFDKTNFINSHLFEVMDDIKEENSFYINVKIGNHDKLLKEFPAFLTENLQRIALSELQFNKQPIQVTINQLNKSLECMKYYEKYNRLNAKSPNRWAFINAGNHHSLFEIFLGIYSAIVAKLPSCILHCDFNRKFLATLLKDQKFETKCSLAENSPSPSKYCSQIVFDSGDLKSAFYQIALSSGDRTSPWRIRNCWIQESLREKFMEIVKNECKHNALNDEYKMEKENATKLGAQIAEYNETTIIIGASRKQIDCDHFVFVNFFRTPKESLNLLNADQMTQCVSIWSENISLTVELAHQLNASNIWINSNGIIEPSLPYTFGENIIYGSEFGPLQQFAGQSNIDVTAVAKDNYEAELIETYSVAKTINKITFNVLSIPRTKNERQIFATLLKDIDCAKERNLIANMAINKFKIISIPFGTIFAN